MRDRIGYQWEIEVAKGCVVVVVVVVRQERGRERERGKHEQYNRDQ